MWNKARFNSKFCVNLVNNRWLTYSNNKFSNMAKQKYSKKGNEKCGDNCPISKDAFISLDKFNNILLNIYAKPGAKQNKITEITEDGVGVQINAPPMDGEANVELVKYISSILGLRKSDVTLEKGFKCKQKMLKISGNNINIERVKERIQKEIQEN